MSVQDHSRMEPEQYRSIDQELADAEREMNEVDEQIRLWKVHQEEKRKRGLRFG